MYLLGLNFIEEVCKIHQTEFCAQLGPFTVISIKSKYSTSVQ